MQKLIVFIGLLAVLEGQGQELYVFTEPASNVPAHSVSLKLTDHFVTSDNIYNRFSQRFMPQVYVGLSRKLMFSISGTISNMHTPGYRYESLRLYTKYRFYTTDAVHRHFRLAAFAEGSLTKAPFHYDEISLMGDKEGISAGLVATQLWHRFALSGSVSHTQLLDRSRFNKVIYVPKRIYQSVNYTVSGGYLLFPKEYTDYKQTNLNLYTEVLAEQVPGAGKYYIDLAPAVQLIFNSNAKLNIGCRFQASGNMKRMTDKSWQVSFERTFLNALKKK